MNNIALEPKTNSTRMWNDTTAYREWDVLIVSARRENRKALLQIFEGLPLNIFTAATIEEAQEVLSSQLLEVIFCEEFLPDGSYRQLLEPLVTKNSATRFVVTLCTGEWDEYLQAMNLGATEVLRCPLQSIDVELVLIRAGRDRERQRLQMLT
jgi:DNA-binding NtrC family response regulator